jgi:uncharacterized protein (TIRG00374 family)
MTQMKFKLTWKTIFLPAVGILAFVLYLYLFNVDIPQIIETIRGINLPIYLLAAFLVVLEVFFFALSWHSLINFLSVKLSVVKSFLYVWYGIFMDIVIPAESISGEISRVYLVTREQNGTGGKVVASLVVHRLMGMAINIVSLFAGLALLLIAGQVNGLVLNLTLFLIAVTIVFLVLMVLLCVKEQWTMGVVDALTRFVVYVSRGRWKLEKVREDVKKAARMFHDSVKEFGRSPKTVAISVFFYALTWLCSLGVSYAVFASLNFPVQWNVIIVTSSIVVAVKSIPIGVPFEVGLPEITMTTLYGALSPDMSLGIAATATILNRLLTVWLRFFIGFAIQQWLEFKAIRSADISIPEGVSAQEKTKFSFSQVLNVVRNGNSHRERFNPAFERSVRD